MKDHRSACCTPSLLLSLLFSLTVLFAFFSSVTSQGSEAWKPESAWELKANKTVWLKVKIGTVIQTDYLEIQMFPELVPKAVDNFVELCKGTGFRSKIDVYIVL